MRFKTSDGIYLEYDDVGKKDNQAVVLLTGIGGYRQIWNATVKTLNDHDYRIINVDSRNQGMSQRTHKGMRISRHAKDLQELLLKLQIENPILIGNSMGASTIFAYISLFGSKQIKAVVDVDQSPKMINDETWKYGFKNLNWQNFRDVLKLPFGTATYREIDHDLFKQIKQLEEQYPYDPGSNYSFLLDHAFQDWRSEIFQIKSPLLIVVGERSPYFCPEFINAVSLINPDVKGKVIKNVGHIVMAEAPYEFNQVLIDFLNSI